MKFKQLRLEEDSDLEGGSYFAIVNKCFLIHRKSEIYQEVLTCVPVGQKAEDYHLSQSTFNNVCGRGAKLAEYTPYSKSTILGTVIC